MPHLYIAKQPYRHTAFSRDIAPSTAAAHPCANPSTPKGGAFLSTVKRARECGPTCRITQTCSKLRATELAVWREEAARVAPEQKDRDTFGGVDAPCLVSHSEVFPSLMQGCHWGSDPETGGNGSHGAVHSTPPGRSKQSRKIEKKHRGERRQRSRQKCAATESSQLFRRGGDSKREKMSSNVTGVSSF